MCTLRLHEAAAEKTQALDSNAHFRIHKMAFFVPSIITPLNQIGLASLSIAVRIVRMDSASGRLIAWGVQSFGVNEEGFPIGIPHPRRFFYAFSGTYDGNLLKLEATNCDFEITAFPVPLRTLSFAASCSEGTWTGTLVRAEIEGNHFRSTTLRRYIRNWLHFVLSRLLRSSITHARANARTAIAACRILLGQKWWLNQFRDSEGNITALGTFCMEACPVGHRRHDLRLIQASFDAQTYTIEAIFDISPQTLFAHSPGILLIDTKNVQPLPLPYSSLTREHRMRDGLLRVSLAIPKSMRQSLECAEAYIMLNGNIECILPLNSEKK
jgi:hypothetical protein